MQLRETVARAVRLSDERRSHDAGADARQPRAAPLAAVIAALDASAEVDADGPQIDESSVPFDRLAELLKPGSELKPHQRRGIAWRWHHAARSEPGVLLADDMGLGKTLQVSAFLALQFPTAGSIVLRREKAQALRDLPPKQFHELPVEMTPHQPARAQGKPRTSA